MIEGVDVSVHNTGEPNTAGLSFIGVRLAYGAAPDPRADAHVAHAKAHGLLTIGYLFLLPKALLGEPVDFQVDLFLRTADRLKVDAVCVDWEGEEHHTPPSRAELIRSVRLLQAAGHKAGVYASEGASYPAVGQDWRWVANYTREPRIRYDIWQYHGGPLDRNRMKISLAAFREKAVGERGATGADVQFILAYDPPKSIAAPSGTVIKDFKGASIATLSTPTKLTTVGIADGHSGQFVVKIRTAKYAPDGQPRYDYLVAVIPNGVPEDKQ